MNSVIIGKSKLNIYYDIAKLCSTDLFRLPYVVNICNILNRLMIIKAVELNVTFEVLTDEEVDELESILATSKTCKTCK